MSKRDLLRKELEKKTDIEIRNLGRDYDVEGWQTMEGYELKRQVLEAIIDSEISKEESEVEEPIEEPKKTERERIWFKLNADQRIAGDAPVFASSNGNAIMIHRNEWVPLPVEYMPCFADAVETVAVMQKNGDIKMTDVLRYNYQTQPLTDINQPPDGGPATMRKF